MGAGLIGIIMGVVGILVTLVFNAILGVLFGIVGIIASIMSFNDKDHQSWAIVGLVLSIIALVLSIIVLLMFFLS